MRFVLLLAAVLAVAVVVLVAALVWPRGTVAQLAAERRRAIDAAAKASRRGQAGAAEDHQRTADELLRRIQEHGR